MLRRGTLFKMLVNNESGAVIILVALLLVGLLGMAALTVDVGFLYQARSAMVNAADAAALAGVQELALGGNTAEVTQAVNEYIEMNDRHADASITTDTDGNRVGVTAEKRVNFFFARIWGYEWAVVDAYAEAVYSDIKSMKGLSPVAITYEYYEIYGSNEPFGSGSGLVYDPNNLQGSSWVPVVLTKDQTLEKNNNEYNLEIDTSLPIGLSGSGEILFVPVYYPTDITIHSASGIGTINRIDGFAALKLDDIRPINGNDEWEIVGSLKRWVTVGEIDRTKNPNINSDGYDLYGIELIK